jgi:AraC-like DNA-binding protein
VIEPLAAGTIAATNVRPAYEMSLAFGVSEAQIETACGLTRATLDAEDACVEAAATYAHMELMAAQPRFAQFLIATTRSHTLSTLGLVGLACKTVATVGEAMLCHHRYQHLTNRTATYASRVDAGELMLRETRPGPVRPGLALVSDYALLIAAHLLRESTGDNLLRRMHSRRAEIPAQQRAAMEALLDAPVETGADEGSLVFDPAIVMRPVATADAELASYFARLLDAGPDPDLDPLLGRVRAEIGAALMSGTPTTARVAKAMGLGPRTLQRRLAERGVSFAEILEGTRRGLAEAYLADPKLTLAEIAFALGYGEAASFHRAFKAWTGLPPGAWRQSRR